jgi:quercetin dioxygenase-like cupin family protein
MSRVQRVDLQLTTGEDRTCVWAGDVARVMRVRLQPGESLPPHDAGADLVLIPLAGRLRFANEEGEQVWGVGEGLAVACGTPMDIGNAGDEPAVFIVVRTPPAEA